MNFNKVVFIDERSGQQIKVLWDDAAFPDDYWDGLLPDTKDQVYFPESGLFEVTKTRFHYIKVSPYVEIFISFIRKVP